MSMGEESKIPKLLIPRLVVRSSQEEISPLTTFNSRLSQSDWAKKISQIPLQRRDGLISVGNLLKASCQMAYSDVENFLEIGSMYSVVDKKRDLLNLLLNHNEIAQKVIALLSFSIFNGPSLHLLSNIERIKSFQWELTKISDALAIDSANLSSSKVPPLSLPIKNTEIPHHLNRLLSIPTIFDISDNDKAMVAKKYFRKVQGVDSNCSINFVENQVILDRNNVELTLILIPGDPEPNWHLKDLKLSEIHLSKFLLPKLQNYWNLTAKNDASKIFKIIDSCKNEIFHERLNKKAKEFSSLIPNLQITFDSENSLILSVCDVSRRFELENTLSFETEKYFVDFEIYLRDELILRIFDLVKIELQSWFPKDFNYDIVLENGFISIIIAGCSAEIFLFADYLRFSSSFFDRECKFHFKIEALRGNDSLLGYLRMFVASTLSSFLIKLVEPITSIELVTNAYFEDRIDLSLRLTKFTRTFLNLHYSSSDVEVYNLRNKITGTSHQEVIEKMSREDFLDLIFNSKNSLNFIDTIRSRINGFIIEDLKNDGALISKQLQFINAPILYPIISCHLDINSPFLKAMLLVNTSFPDMDFLDILECHVRNTGEKSIIELLNVSTDLFDQVKKISMVVFSKYRSSKS